MSTAGRRPARVAVTSPQTRLALARRPASGSARLAPGGSAADVDTALLRRVLAAQRRVAARTVAALGLLLGLLPLVLAHLPVLTRRTLAGVPLAWLVLGVAVYPMLLALARHHLRRVEELERRVVAARRDPP